MKQALNLEIGDLIISKSSKEYAIITKITHKPKDRKKYNFIELVDNFLEECSFGEKEIEELEKSIKVHLITVQKVKKNK
jgi:hypothetical protein